MQIFAIITHDLLTSTLTDCTRAATPGLLGNVTHELILYSEAFLLHFCVFRMKADAKFLFSEASLSLVWSDSTKCLQTAEQTGLFSGAGKFIFNKGSSSLDSHWNICKSRETQLVDHQGNSVSLPPGGGAHLWWGNLHIVVRGGKSVWRLQCYVSQGICLHTDIPDR